jgi:nucleotide-binding universal stress UspA family protein
MYDRILVCLDGTRDSEAILPEINRLLKIHPAQVILLTVGAPIDVATAVREMSAGYGGATRLMNDEYEMLSTNAELEIRQYLDRISEALKEAGAETVVEVSFNDPVSEILFFARHYNADLIAMATHGRKGLSRLLHGSVTESVLEQAPCPLLVVRTGAAF